MADHSMPVASHPDDDHDIQYQQVMTAQLAASPQDALLPPSAPVHDSRPTTTPMVNGTGPRRPAGQGHEGDEAPSQVDTGLERPLSLPIGQRAEMGDLAPSPLPEPSVLVNQPEPGAYDVARTAGRASSEQATPLQWMMRLGDFFQRISSTAVSGSAGTQRAVLHQEMRTSWPPTNASMEGAPWATSSTSPSLMPPGTAQHLQNVSPLLQPPRSTNTTQHGAPSDGTSESLHREDVQAEVKRQLAGVMTQLQEERRKSEEALAQAQAMRMQLEMERAGRSRTDGLHDGNPMYAVDGNNSMDGQHVKMEGRDARANALLPSGRELMGAQQGTEPMHAGTVGRLNPSGSGIALGGGDVGWASQGDLLGILGGEDNLMDYLSNRKYYLALVGIWLMDQVHNLGSQQVNCEDFVKHMGLVVWVDNLLDYRSNRKYYLVITIMMSTVYSIREYLMYVSLHLYLSYLHHQFLSPNKAPGNSSTSMSSSERVLLSMARGIEELLNKNQSASGLKQGQPETVKPGVHDLPKLDEYAPETAAIDLINWMTHISPILEDISDTSGAWWGETLRQASQWYQAFAAASPLQRLQMKPRATGLLLKPEWSRVERRAAAMLLSAVPEAQRRDIITHGDVTALGVMCRILTVYQPGNKQEKTLILRNLEAPPECQSSMQAVEGLRKWLLWLKRARSIGIVEPDASILMRGLDRLSQDVIRADHELAFRVSLMRASLQVDNNPQPHTVLQYHQHLLAELETHVRTMAGDATTSTTSPPRVKGVSASSTPTNNESPKNQGPPTTTPPDVCKFYLKDKGCTRGNKCRYKHTMAGLPKEAKKSKCLACGSTSHRVKDCSVPGVKRKDKDTTEGGGNPSSSSSSTTPVTLPNEGASGQDKAAARPLRAITFEPSETAEVKTLMERALDEIKKMRVLRMTCDTIGQAVRGALLDSGATHALRGATAEERATARTVDVVLAGEGRASMKQTDAGTLLVDDKTPGLQTIVPLGRLIKSLGYSLSWDANGCWLVCPDGAKEELSLRNGCPEIGDERGLRLIEELENQVRDVTQASAKNLQEQKVSWWMAMLRYVETREVMCAQEAWRKAAFLKAISEEEMMSYHDLEDISPWERLKGLPVNRRRRKRLSRSSTWILRWISHRATSRSNMVVGWKT
ncbi:unnamed protein product [Symbiodinium natans]|uniref:C3H1-type domain-containing protein n=1 Tax=Symbiodinium natans TaxID=878477 RepID=A0A812LPY2_9DINO|nr:unnamed protein product [Symbiodinium natans]